MSEAATTDVRDGEEAASSPSPVAATSTASAGSLAGLVSDQHHHQLQHHHRHHGHSIQDDGTNGAGDDAQVLDMGGGSLERLCRAAPEHVLNTTVLILDRNQLQRLDNIHTYQCLERVSKNGH